MKLSSIAKQMILVICILTVVIMSAGAVYFRSLEALYFAIGALSVGLLNVSKVVILERVVEKVVDMESGPAVNYIRIQYLLRFVLTGGVLVFAALCPFVNLWGAVAAIFTLPISAFCTRFFEGRDDGADKTA